MAHRWDDVLRLHLELEQNGHLALLFLPKPVGISHWMNLVRRFLLVGLPVAATSSVTGMLEHSQKRG